MGRAAETQTSGKIKIKWINYNSQVKITASKRAQKCLAGNKQIQKNVLKEWELLLKGASFYIEKSQFLILCDENQSLFHLLISGTVRPMPSERLREPETGLIAAISIFSEVLQVTQATIINKWIAEITVSELVIIVFQEEANQKQIIRMWFDHLEVLEASAAVFL